MDTAILRQVIETQILRRGAGVDGDPVRVITQIWTTDGELLAEKDPFRIEPSEFAVIRHQRDVLKERIVRLESAIRWVLGEGNSDFGDHMPDDPKKKPYWWRGRLRLLAGL